MGLRKPTGRWRSRIGYCLIEKLEGRYLIKGSTMFMTTKYIITMLNREPKPETMQTHNAATVTPVSK